MKPLRVWESMGTLVVGVGIVVAIFGWAMYGHQASGGGGSGSDFAADATLWGGVGLALLGVVVSIGARTLRSWRE